MGAKEGSGTRGTKKMGPAGSARVGRGDHTKGNEGISEVMPTG